MKLRVTASPASAAPAPLSAAPGNVVRRRCACGTQAGDERDGGCAECARKSGTLQRKTQHGARVDAVPDSVRRVLQSPGQSLGADVRGQMESRFGRDFSAVRVHTGADAARSAHAIDAAAYTLGPDIVFGAGRFAPATAPGQRLLAHELAHVVQQAGQPAAPSGGLRIGAADDAHEVHADRVADAVLRSDAAPAAEPAAASHAEPAVRREPESDPHIGPGLPGPPGQLGGLTIRLELGSNMAPTGKASVTVAGPGSIPLVGGAEIGLRRNADGTYTAVTGKGDTIVSAADVAKIVQGSTSIDPKKPKELRLPGYKDLHRPDGTLYSVAEFKQHALYLPGANVTGIYWHGLPDWFLQVLIDACKPVPLLIPDRPPRPDYNDAPAPAGNTRVA